MNRILVLVAMVLASGVVYAQGAQSPNVIPNWVPTLLSGLSVAGFTYILNRQAKRDDRLDRLESSQSELRLIMAKEYFSSDQAHNLVTKLDAVIEELHKQNITLARVETELRANRQATLSHPTTPPHAQ